MKQYLTILIVLITCSGFVHEPEQCYAKFKEWYTEHHEELDLKVAQEELLFESRYLPNEVSICAELLQAEKATSSQIKDLYKRLDAYETYTIKISQPGEKELLLAQAEDKTDYQNKQFYLIENVRFDFALVRDNDTVMPLNCQFENNYGATPYVALHLTFDKPKKKITKRHLIYSDQLFGKGLIVFDYSFLSNLQIPKIK